MDCRQAQLCSSPGRYYPCLEVQPPIVEVLLLPFFVAGEAKGTVWSMAHDEQRIDALLALAQIGKAGGEFRPTSLATVLEEVLADLHSQFEAAGATVQRDPLPTVRGHAGQLRSLLQNLLTNAVKFRHPDRLPAVRLSATEVAYGVSSRR